MEEYTQTEERFNCESIEKCKTIAEEQDNSLLETDFLSNFDEKTRERIKRAQERCNERFFKMFKTDKNAKPTLTEDDLIKAAVALEMSNIKTNAEDIDQKFKPCEKNPLDPYDTLEWLDKEEKIEENLKKRTEMFDEKCKQYGQLSASEKESKIYDAFAHVRELNDKLIEMDKNNVRFCDPYWKQTFVNASITAMRGLLESGKHISLSDMLPEELAKTSVKIGKALVRELMSETGSGVCS